MATWKCDVQMKFGKFTAHVGKPTERTLPTVASNLSDARDAAAAVAKGLEQAGYDEGDEVIFRDTAYGSLTELREVLRKAPY
jgi:topoisomerase IA-like protein